jgi:hypothetical protein
LLELGIGAYGELEFDDADALLQRALSDASAGGLDRSEQQRALTYLAAIEVYRGDSDSAAVLFRRVINIDPRYRPDQLVFPPEVTEIYEAERGATRIVTVSAPGGSEFKIGEGTFPVHLYTSAPHRISVEVDPDAVGRARLLYSGMIRDSLRVRWDGRDSEGMAAASGAYQLRVTSEDEVGRVTRTVELPMTVRLERPDTLPLPGPPADSLFLPEEKPPGPALEALAGGVIAAALVLFVPSAFNSELETSTAQIAVAGALATATVAGVVVNRPGRVIQANVEANAATRSEAEAHSEAVARENDRRRADVRILITTGAATVTRQVEE